MVFFAMLKTTRNVQIFLTFIKINVFQELCEINVSGYYENFGNFGFLHF